MSDPQAPTGSLATGSLDVALAHAQRLMEHDPAAAATQAREILAAVPGHPMAVLILGAALRKCGELDEALATLGPLARAQPRSALTHFELGLALGAKGRGDQAMGALRLALALKPDLTPAWRALGDHLAAIGDERASDEAYAQSIRYASRDPRLLEAGAHLVAGELAPAEALLREHLKQQPTDVAAIRMLGEVATRLGRYGDAETLFRRAIELAPSFIPARHNLAVVLYRQTRSEEALEQIDLLLVADPANPSYRVLKAAALGRIGDYTGAIDLYREVLAGYPAHAKVWMSYGHALKTARRQDEAVAAYRKSIEIAPSLGEAWWSLANLKTVRFSKDDLATVRTQLESEDLGADDRLHFEFAAGKALEDAGEYAESFDHYKKGNAIRRTQVQYDAHELTDHVQRSKALFTPEFFAERAGVGCEAPDPIFIVGLPRSGSTLIEQILSSHSQIEGTQELPDIAALVRGLGGRKLRSQVSAYPEVLASLDVKEFHALGESFLARTRIHRKAGTPFFIDKMPNNFAHVGFIQLILPRARIVDARRHPLGCCFSGFKQHFARGQTFTYDLAEIGRYYRDYVELMAHFDAVLPGRVHRIHYEAMVENTADQVHRLLEYCHVPFEPACLRFYENERAVRTASSEQVRTPIYREGLEQWRHYEPWLGPLAEALGPVLTAYPHAPAF